MQHIQIDSLCVYAVFCPLIVERRPYAQHPIARIVASSNEYGEIFISNRTIAESIRKRASMR